MFRKCYVLTMVALSIAILFLLSPPAVGLDIVIDYQDIEFEPVTDPDGLRIKALAAHVAEFYEDIIRTPHTLTVRLQYEQTGFTNGSFVHTKPDTGTNRTTEGILRINPIPDNNDPVDDVYYYDPTPWDDSEFDMAQKLFRDLTNEQASDRFKGNVPDVFEAGYRGAAKSTAPAEAKNGTDLLTILFHEVGHGLGLSSSLENLYKVGEVDETDDGDFDFNTDFVAGNVMAAKVRPTNPHTVVTDEGRRRICRSRANRQGRGPGPLKRRMKAKPKKPMLRWFIQAAAPASAKSRTRSRLIRPQVAAIQARPQMRPAR